MAIAKSKSHQEDEEPSAPSAGALVPEPMAEPEIRVMLNYLIERVDRMNQAKVPYRDEQTDQLELMARAGGTELTQIGAAIKEAGDNNRDSLKILYDRYPWFVKDVMVWWRDFRFHQTKLNPVVQTTTEAILTGLTDAVQTVSDTRSQAFELQRQSTELDWRREQQVADAEAQATAGTILGQASHGLDVARHQLTQAELDAAHQRTKELRAQEQDHEVTLGEQQLASQAMKMQMLTAALGGSSDATVLGQEIAAFADMAETQSLTKTERDGMTPIVGESLRRTGESRAKAKDRLVDAAVGEQTPKPAPRKRTPPQDDDRHTDETKDGRRDDRRR